MSLKRLEFQTFNTLPEDYIAYVCCDECLQYCQKGEEVAQTGHAKIQEVIPPSICRYSIKYPLRGDTIQYIYTD